MNPRVLVMAKAPVAGLAKTRLGADVGMAAAAEVAAAALLDTLAVCRAGFAQRYLALAGDLSLAARSAELSRALPGWTVFEQQGTTLGERLAHAHGWVAARGPGPVVQVGMDTPHMSSAALRSVVDQLAAGATAVLGPAEDGGWWVLGLADPREARCLSEVVMSSSSTYADTRAALDRAGARLGLVETLRDIDTVDDATVVAGEFPRLGFARSWQSLLESEPVR